MVNRFAEKILFHKPLQNILFFNRKLYGYIGLLYIFSTFYYNLLFKNCTIGIIQRAVSPIAMAISISNAITYDTILSCVNRENFMFSNFLILPRVIFLDNSTSFLFFMVISFYPLVLLFFLNSFNPQKMSTEFYEYIQQLFSEHTGAGPQYA